MLDGMLLDEVVSEDIPPEDEPPEGMLPDDIAPGAPLLLFPVGSPCDEDVDGAEPLAGPLGIAVESPVVPGAVCICPGVWADWAMAAPAMPRLRLRPIVAIMSFCIVLLRK